VTRGKGTILAGPYRLSNSRNCSKPEYQNQFSANGLGLVFANDVT